jgi:NDP-hexose-3-ketoreductase
MTIGIGVLGCSSIAARSVIPAIRATPDVKLVAVASRDPDKARAFAQRYETQGCSYSELLARSDVDAVYVSLPVGLHYEQGLAVLAAGKHLLLEKTFTATYDQAVRLQRAAAERQLVAMEALMYLFHPLQERIRSLIEGGAIGEVRHVSAEFGFPALPASDFRLDKALGGGAALDVLVYPLSFAMEMMRVEPKRADVILQFSRNVDTRGFVQLDFGGRVAQLAYGYGFHYRNCVRVWGSVGELSVDERAFTRSATTQLKIAVSGPSGAQTYEIPPADHFALMLAHFARRVCGAGTPGPAEGERLAQRMAELERVRRAGGIVK